MKVPAFSFLALMLVGFSLSGTVLMNSSTKNMPDTPYDGPYVLYRNDKVYVKYILDENGKRKVWVDSSWVPGSSISPDKKTLSLPVATDDSGRTFLAQLKSKLQDEKAEFPNVKKQLVLSDIEGNFGPFRKLLQVNGVIDSAFNWTFGDGHLVLIGDFFDRGNQVTEVLWLIYSLEDKAKAAGGYVHFVLGNHEIMNMSGDLRYVQPKYLEDAALLNENYVTLYGENSELGRWLRTKNIIEKVGNVLFLHGGFSAEMNNLDISLARINKLARPYYSDSTYRYPDETLELIYGEKGPFWYRGYYMGDRSDISDQIANTLSKFGVKHIATGHTIVADTVSTWYNGRLFNTDVHHAEGKSEALLIEGDKYYRVSFLGEKFQIL